MPEVMHVDSGQVVNLAHDIDVQRATDSGKWVAVAPPAAQDAPLVPGAAEPSRTLRPIMDGPAVTVSDTEAHMLLSTGRYDEGAPDETGDPGFRISDEDREKLPILGAGVMQTVYDTVTGNSATVHAADAIKAIRSGRYSLSPEGSEATVGVVETEEDDGARMQVTMTEDGTTPKLVMKPVDEAVLNEVATYEEPPVPLHDDAPSLAVEPVDEPEPKRRHYTSTSKITIGPRTESVKKWCQINQVPLPTGLYRLNKSGQDPSEALFPRKEK